jgi:hypothetical protein
MNNKKIFKLTTFNVLSAPISKLMSTHAVVKVARFVPSGI